MDIGAKLKRIRTAKELTLEELASRSELSKGFLSQVERNLTSPSISTLEDIVEALGTSLSEFFSEEEPEQIVFKKTDFFVNEQEECVVCWIVPNAQKNEMEPVLLTLKPNGTSNMVKSHSGQEFGYVVEGMVQLILDGQDVQQIKKGETFYLNRPADHYLKNGQKKEAQVIWVSTPPIF